MKKIAFWVWLLFFSGSNVFGQNVQLTGQINHLSATEITCSLLPLTLTAKPTKSIIEVNRGFFQREFDLPVPTYLVLSDGANTVVGLIEPGDQLRISYDSLTLTNSLRIEGRGQKKFDLIRLTDALKPLAKQQLSKARSQTYPLDYLYEKIDSAYFAIHKQLVAHKSKMQAGSYSQLNGYLEAMTLRVKYNGLVEIFGDSFDGILNNQSQRLSEFSKRNMKNLLSFADTLAASPFYVNMVANILSTYYEENIQPIKGNHLKTKYSYLASRLPATLRAPVLFQLIDRELDIQSGAVMDTIVSLSFASPVDSAFFHLVKSKLAASRQFKVGMLAPEFNLETLDGKTITLSSFKGKVVYLDFWFAGCVPCQQLFNRIKPVKEYFRADTNVVFLVVSVDDRQTWKKAITSFGVEGYHALTENKFRNHAIIRDYHISAYPTTYLIDQRGKFNCLELSSDPTVLKAQIMSALASTTSK